MPAQDKVHGSAVIEEMETLILTAMALKPSGTTEAADAEGGLAALPIMAGMAETHPAETMVHGSLAAPQTGSAAIKTHKPEHKNADRLSGGLKPLLRSPLRIEHF